jgi:hypothetical protein
MRALEPVWKSVSLSPEERLAMVFLLGSLSCPGGRGPEYHRKTSKDLVASCGLTPAGASRIWATFVRRGWIVSHQIDDGGPAHWETVWIMPARGRYEF